MQPLFQVLLIFGLEDTNPKTNGVWLTVRLVLIKAWIEKVCLIFCTRKFSQWIILLFLGDSMSYMNWSPGRPWSSGFFDLHWYTNTGQGFTYLDLPSHYELYFLCESWFAFANNHNKCEWMKSVTIAGTEAALFWANKFKRCEAKCLQLALKKL